WAPNLPSSSQSGQSYLILDKKHGTSPPAKTTLYSPPARTTVCRLSPGSSDQGVQKRPEGITRRSRVRCAMPERKQLDCVAAQKIFFFLMTLPKREGNDLEYF